jgi:hypothetical protein
LSHASRRMAARSAATSSGTRRSFVTVSSSPRIDLPCTFCPLRNLPERLERTRSLLLSAESRDGSARLGVSTRISRRTTGDACGETSREGSVGRIDVTSAVTSSAIVGSLPSVSSLTACALCCGGKVPRAWV